MVCQPTRARARGSAFSTADAPADGFLLSGEYKNKSITKIVGGDVYIGCYLLAITIFLLGMVRDSLYVFSKQPSTITAVFILFLFSSCIP